MQPDLFRKPRRDTTARGTGKAIDVASKLNNRINKVILEYRQLNTPEARGVFADEWLRMMTMNLQEIWGPFYELMSLVKKEELYSNAAYMNGKTFESFGDFWKDVTAKTLQEWAELESTYRYIHENCPELLSKIGYSEAKAVARLNPPGVKLGDITSTNGTSEPIKRGSNRVEYLTARLARDYPELKLEDFPSVRAAALSVGIVKPSFQCPMDPEKAARRLRLHFTGDKLETLIRCLKG